MSEQMDREALVEKGSQAIIATYLQTSSWSASIHREVGVGEESREVARNYTRAVLDALADHLVPREELERLQDVIAEQNTLIDALREDQRRCGEALDDALALATEPAEGADDA